jgi:hypothetical protein
VLLVELGSQRAHAARAASAAATAASGEAR